jgi:hypothetical protein
MGWDKPLRYRTEVVELLGPKLRAELEEDDQKRKEEERRAAIEQKARDQIEYEETLERLRKEKQGSIPEVALTQEPTTPNERGRPPIPENQKADAYPLWKAGKGNREVAGKLYRTKIPTPAQRRSVSTILKLYESHKDREKSAAKK